MFDARWEIRLVALVCLLAAGGCHVIFPYTPGERTELGVDRSSRDSSGERSLDIAVDQTSCRSQILTLATVDDDGEITVEAGVAKWWDEQGEGPKPPPDEPGLYIGYWYQGATWSYFRFALSETIPAGATIEARLELWGKYVTSQWSATSHALRVYGELSTDASVVASMNDLPGAGSRRFTQASVRWPDTGGLLWSTDRYNELPDLSAIVRELVAAGGGLVAGSHLQLWLAGDFSTGGAEVLTPEFRESQPAGHLPRLTLHHCTP